MFYIAAFHSNGALTQAFELHDGVLAGALAWHLTVHDIHFDDGVKPPDAELDFVVKDGAAQVQPVKVERQIGTESVIASGLNGGEMIVTEGQLLLSNGTRVNPRPPKVAGS